MRTWVRAEITTLCGGVAAAGQACPRVIRVGEPMLVLAIAGLERKKFRCQLCAGEPAPELPPLSPRVPMQPMVHIPTGAGALPFDFKARAAGDREPGQEG